MVTEILITVEGTWVKVLAQMCGPQENEGVRVTVIRSSDHSVVTIPIDITNKKPSASIYNFGKVSKVQYSNGKALSPVKGGYQSIKPKQTIPKIISTNGKTNLACP